jgi:hypothetical protein
MTHFKEKISPLRRAIFQIFGHRSCFQDKIPQNIEKWFFKIFFILCLPIQKYIMHSNVQNSKKNHCTPSTLYIGGENITVLI